MGYSDEDLNQGDDPSHSDIPVWNSGSVYYDDEVVEYQGKYYTALRKTSAEVPGRSKAGIWKERQEVEESYDYDSDDNIYDEKIVPAKVQIKPNNTPVKAKETISKSARSNNTVENKKILQEQEASRDENLNTKPASAEENSSATAQLSPVQKPVPRKMTISPDDQNIVNEILKKINFETIKGLNSDDNNISSNLILPQSLVSEASTFTWESSHPDIISSKGEVNRPHDGHDIAVNLSLSVSKNKASSTRFFTLWVKGAEKIYTDEECVKMVYKALSFDHIKGKNRDISDISYNLELLTQGLYDTEIFWASSNRELIDETGILYKTRLSQNTMVRLYAIIVKNKTQVLKSFELNLKLLK